MQNFTYKLIEDGTYCVMAYQGDEETVVIPDNQNITILYDDLFKGHAEITSVHIPDTVTDMGEFIFDGCENLRHITLPAQLENLWGHTFTRSGIEEITLPDRVRSIPPFAFKDCSQLKKVVCSPGLKKIHAWAFGGCSQLETVVHGPDVEVSPQAYESKEWGGKII